MRRGLTFSELAVGLAFVAIAVLACLSPAQADTFWALRAGEDIWRTGRVPLVDAYSHTAAGRPWPNHEWLWQAMVYGLYRAGGFPLLTFAIAAMITGAHAIAYRLMTGPWPPRVGILLAGVTAGASAWAVRPQVASLLMLAVLAWLLARGRERLVPPLFALWANLHGGVVLGGFVMVVVTAGAFVYDRRRAPRLAVATVLGGAATLLTPLGIGLWRFIVHWAAAARQTGVSEWEPVLPTNRQGILFWVLLLGFAIAVARRWRRLPRNPDANAWPDRLLAIAALALVPFAVRAVRNVSPFLIVAMPAAARLVAARLPGAPVGETGTPRPRFNLALLAACALAGVVAIGASWSRPSPALGWAPITPASSAALASCPGPLYNGYNEGGYLIWFARDKPVFIDSRHDPYPPELIIEDREVERGGDHHALFSRYGIRCAALSTNAILADSLRAAGWRQRFADPQWVVLEPPQ